jgi:hypothetical protein
VLLKIILLAYSRGITSSRRMEAACRENVLFMAISGDAQPHFTTLGGFISEVGELAATLFSQVLVVCDRQQRIGRELFAIDGVKLPSTASWRRWRRRRLRQVAFFHGKAAGSESVIERMKRKIDSPLGKQVITRRFATVEAVFGNLRHNKRLDRFSLRGRAKVDAQWTLYCLTHNIEKLAQHGYAV